MSSLALILAISVASSPAAINSVKDVTLNPPAIKKCQGMWIIAQKYGGQDPHGPDPHGDDPHDEVHDKSLPANADKTGKAPKDVYGGKVGNDQAPY